MAFQFINYSLDDFNTEQINVENETSIWNSAELCQSQNLNHPRAPLNINSQQNFQLSSNFIYWRPSRQLQSLQKKFNDKILIQFPSVPCSFCSILMFPANAKWIQKEENRVYPLALVFPNEQPIEHINDSSKIAVCSTCKEPRLRRSPPNVVNTPDEIERVPIYHRRWLSPIYLSCSLGRVPNSNAYTNYRTLSGKFNFSKNIRALDLYSGTMGAILENNSNQHWYHETLNDAACWLKNNNPFFKPYHHITLHTNQDGSRIVFPTARISDDMNNLYPSSSSSHPINRPEIIMAPYDFNTEIHDEDFDYSRLMAGFISDPNEKQLPISYNDKNLEGLIFPDLFPTGEGFYKHENRQLHADSYQKYIKRCLLSPNPKFRLHPYWPHWSYMNLEKIRNHQNHSRILRQKNINQQRHITTADLITTSTYNNRPIINENITTTLPSFIRTGNTYFKEKEYHVRAMVNAFQLPQIFYTTTMNENGWEHLKTILTFTDNGDTNPTNRPLHTYLHYHHRLESIRNKLWKNPKLSEWGKFNHYWERDEFQNRGAIHTHGVAWVEKPIDELIELNVIRADVPNPIHEPELYELVTKFQIHHCRPEMCNGPCAPGERCSKGFPQPLSATTHLIPNSYYYTYKRTKPEDQWVVPYHGPTLLLWQAHCCFMYVTSIFFAYYITKYITKPEPIGAFDLEEHDVYRKHIMARRIASLEIMILLLGYKLCRSSIAVNYLPSLPPLSRSKSIKPVHLILEDEENPYWDDAIEKYLKRPQSDIFHNITYPKYHQQYQISSKPPNTNRQYWIDLSGNYVIKRQKDILVRFHHTSVESGEEFFYQQLLLRFPFHNEAELLNNFATYKEHFQSKFPQEYRKLVSDIKKQSTIQSNAIIENYIQLIQQVTLNINGDLQAIIKKQLTSLINPIPYMTRYSSVISTDDQYFNYNILTSSWGSAYRGKYPYFFLTGPAGTGKSFMINLITTYLTNCHKNYLLMAPTGVAAQNINGKTIHSELQIKPNSGNYMSLAMKNAESRLRLRNIDAIIIDEVSMVSPYLLDFINQMFCELHNCTQPFGGIMVLLIGDLAQLPPVGAPFVFKSASWNLFMPLILHTPRRHSDDLEFFEILQQIRFNQITEETWEKLKEKLNTPANTNSPLETTYIVGYRYMADILNETIMNYLPVDELDDSFISIAEDRLNYELWNDKKSNKHFRKYTNFPDIIQIQRGARVMFLNNTLYSNGIYNGSIGIITKIHNEESIDVTFLTKTGLTVITVNKTTDRFNYSGQPASRHQFPIQNAFALTVHKTQGLTLLCITISLDSQMFASGQAYVAIGRAKTWDSVNLIGLDHNAFKTDESIVLEYERLQVKYDQLIASFRI
jgi:hypothetical protein